MTNHIILFKVLLFCNNIRKQENLKQYNTVEEVNVNLKGNIFYFRVICRFVEKMKTPKK